MAIHLKKLLPLLLFLPMACGTQDETPLPEIVCLYSEGSDHYRTMCQFLIQELEAKVSGDYKFFIENQPNPPKPNSAVAEPGPESNPSGGKRVVRDAPLKGAMDILDAIARNTGDSGKKPKEADGADAVKEDSGPTPERFFIGFTQSDVAYYFRSGGHPLYPTAHRQRDRVISLGRLYPEYLYIYSEGTSEACTLLECFQQWEEIYLGAPGSGTLISSLNVLSLLVGEPLAVHGSNLHEVREFFYEDGNLDVGADRQGKPAGALLVSGPGNQQIGVRLQGGQGKLISLRESEARHVENAFSGLYRIGELPGTGESSYRVVEVPSLLVASRGLPADAATAALDFIARLDESSSDAFLLDRWRNIPKKDRKTDERFISDLYHALKEYRGEKARKENPVLSPHRAYLDKRQDRGVWELAIAAASVFLGILLVRKAIRSLPEHGSILDLSPWLTGPIAVLLCIAWLHICLLIAWRLELRHYMTYQTDTLSPFIQKDYLSLFPMVLHYIASAFSAERLFPISRGAQLLWLSIPLLIGISTLVGLVHVALPPVLGYLRQHLNEEARMELKDHFVICNWNTHADEIVRQIRLQERMAGGSDPCVVVLAQSEDLVTLPKLGVQKASNLPEHMLYGVPPAVGEDDGGGILKVFGFLGNPQDEMTLRMANPEAANTIIVFPDSTQPTPDSATVLTILKLQDILGPESQTRVIVWCEDSRNVPLLLDPRFRLSDVCSTEWAWRVICQATRVGHVSNIYRHLLTSSADSNEFYEFCLPEEWPGGTFQQLQESILRFNRENCEEVPGWEGHKNTILVVGFFDQGDQLRKEPLINPPPDCRLEAGDCLLFLTYVFDQQSREKLTRFLLAEA